MTQVFDHFRGNTALMSKCWIFNVDFKMLEKLMDSKIIPQIKNPYFSIKFVLVILLLTCSLSNVNSQNTNRRVTEKCIKILIENFRLLMILENYSSILSDLSKRYQHETDFGILDLVSRG